ncbi:LysR family transcriptional regulator [Nocardia sp. NPDC005978]|uniref:LysR family transcriptional regulator n=1 Tax=Nocardia sp. NPDC005978 TaxID=3156725 RepID=UPI0033B00609
MERHEIEAFLTLAQELHFGRTAERLGLSQGRMSQTIAKLERQFGSPLFERTSRQVRLTPVGRQLRDDLEPAFRQIQRAVARAKAASREVSGVLRVGYQGAGTTPILRAVIDEFRLAHPGCDVQLRECQLSDWVRGLREDTIDMLCTLSPINEPDLRTGPILRRDPRVLAIASDHPLAQQDSISMEQLVDLPLLGIEGVPEYWMRAQNPPRTPQGAPLRSGIRAATHTELLALAAEGRGVCLGTDLMAEHYRHPQVSWIPVPDGPRISWGLIWRAAGEDARIRAFAGVAGEFARDRPWSGAGPD